MLKVGIVGCGKIADDHAEQLQRIDGCEIVGVCDREPLMAYQLKERYPVRATFERVEDMLSEARPDVVHITTPPQSHFSLAKVCLEAGAHVYVEKPFTVFEHEARELVALAEEKGLKITAGHDCQFRHGARHMRSLIKSGYLGDRVVHMDSYFCYELGPGAYASALLSDKNSWVRRLPGGLLQNVISHGIAPIAEYITSDHPIVSVCGLVSPLLRSLGEQELIDELRVIVSEESGTTAYFTFSSQMRPVLHQFQVYGSKNGLILDHDHETVIRVQGQRYVSYVDKFVPPVAMARQYLAGARDNVGRFLARDFHMKSGMKYLIDSFYRSINDGTAAPIPYREILLTAHIMEQIFNQLASNVQAPTESPSLQIATI